MADSNQRANLVACCLLILSIPRRNKVEMFHKNTASTGIWSRNLMQGTTFLFRFFFSRYNAYRWYEHFCIFFFFSASAASRPNFFPINGIKVMISGTAIDCFDRLSRVRAFPYGRFKIYSIVPIVSIELNSIQAIEVIPVVQVVCDRAGSFLAYDRPVETIGTIRTIRSILWKPGFFHPNCHLILEPLDNV